MKINKVLTDATVVAKSLSSTAGDLTSSNGFGSYSSGPSLSSSPSSSSSLDVASVTIGLLKIVSFIGKLLDPSNEQLETLPTILTHFALVLSYNDGSMYWLERNNDENVVYERLYHEPDSDVMMFNRWSNDMVIVDDWHGSVPADRIETFVQQQRNYEYRLSSKNCKYLVFDFLRHVLYDDDMTCNGNFPSFCERNEGEYRELQNHPNILVYNPAQ